MNGPPPDSLPESADVKVVLAEFDARRDSLKELCAKTKDLIEVSLRDANILFHSVQSRVKSIDKLRTKYLDRAKNYKSLDDITDLAGLRIITYYEDEVDKAAEVVKREFDVDFDRSVDKRGTEPDRFGYYGLNYVCRHSPKRAADVEYKRFAGIYWEIQITSILRHAWSEIEHDWYDMRPAYPPEIKRRFYRLAALLEIAESEFLDLRKKKSSYQRSIDVQVEASVPDLPLDAVSLNSLIQQEPLIAELDRSIAQSWGVDVSPDLIQSAIEDQLKATSRGGLVTVKGLRDSLRRYDRAILEYAGRTRAFTFEGRDPGAFVLAKGACVFQLGVMLIGMRGEDELISASKALTPEGRLRLALTAAPRAAISGDIKQSYGSLDASGS